MTPSARALCAAVTIAASSFGAARGQGAIVRQAAVAGARVLQVDAGGGSLRLLAQAHASGVTVRVVRSGSGSAPQVSSSRSGDRLLVSISSGISRSVIPFAATSAAVAYTVLYPQSMRLNVRASSGNVSVIAPLRQVDVYDDGGNVTVTSPSGNLTAESSDGDIAVTGARAGVDLAADAGNVSVGFAVGRPAGNVRVLSPKGSIHVAFAAPFEGRLDTGGSKSVHVSVARSSARTPLVWLYAPNGGVWVTDASAGASRAP